MFKFSSTIFYSTYSPNSPHEFHSFHRRSLVATTHFSRQLFAHFSAFHFLCSLPNSRAETGRETERKHRRIHTQAHIYIHERGGARGRIQATGDETGTRRLGDVRLEASLASTRDIETCMYVVYIYMYI